MRPVIAAFLIVLREGFEAALVIGVVLATLHQLAGGRGISAVWAGVAGGLVFTLLAATAGLRLLGRWQGSPAEPLLEAAAMLVAVAVLSTMVVWLRGAGHSRQAIAKQVRSSAASRHGRWALAALGFAAVAREGLEVALFLVGAVHDTPTWLIAAGAALGLLLAVLLGLLLYAGGQVLDLRTFFRTTSILLVVMAAGLLAHAAGKLHRAGWLPPLVATLWDTGHFIPKGSWLGVVLGALAGYTPRPSLVQVLLWVAYLALALPKLLRSRPT